MAVIVREFKNAPKWAQFSSTFKTDPRCKEVAAIYGESHEEVMVATKQAHIALQKSTDKVTDYDVNFDNVSQNWVGVTCIDV